MPVPQSSLVEDRDDRELVEDREEDREEECTNAASKLNCKVWGLQGRTRGCKAPKQNLSTKTLALEPKWLEPKWLRICITYYMYCIL